MLVHAMLLVLLSAFLHALWNAILKQTRNLESSSLGILAVSMVTTWAAVPLLAGPAFPRPWAIAWSLAAGLFEGVYFLALTRALDRAPLGWSYTWMRGTAILLVWPASALCLGERVHPVAAVSAAVLCLGLAAMGLAPGLERKPHSLRWALVTGVAIACYTLCYKLALTHGGQPVAVYAVSTCLSLPILVLMRVRRRGLPEGLTLPGQPWRVAAAGLLCAGSFLLYLKALALEGAGAMTTLRNTSVVFAVLLSTALGERPTPRQWLGAALVAAGAGGLALS